MRDEFMIERQGKKYVLYAGLLDEAHSRGLRSIETELVQTPRPENGDIAIVHAVIRTDDGKFTGIGDASPQNVNANIAPHSIRMAETRAKARALRDAINVSEAILEDAGDHGSDTEDAAPHAVPPRRSGPLADVSADRQQTEPIGPPAHVGGKPATISQKARIRDLLKRLNIPEESLEMEYGPVDAMDHGTAVNVIHDMLDEWEKARA